MRYSYSMPAGIAGSAFPAPAISVVLYRPTEQRADADRRWPAILRKLTSLRRRGRRSVRIVDANCGAGDLLVQAVRRARLLGFVAIEGRGVDSDATLIAQARAAARRAADPAIGLEFEVGDARQALDDEADFPADIVLYAARSGDDAVRRAAGAAGRTVLGLPAADRCKDAA
jgi:hypothetical protein